MTSTLHKSKLWLYFVLIVFAIMFWSSFFLIACVFAMYNAGVSFEYAAFPLMPIIAMFLLSIFIGTTISCFVAAKILRPISSLSNALRSVAKGDFSVRLNENTRIDEINAMSASFNRMANELSDIETLRSDFVVNVSHEFKTPIASIEGYATLLQDDALSDEKRAAYVEKIIESSRQLSKLTGNILTLSKLENQDTLSAKKTYRLDEQIRRSVLMLEPMWSAKNISFDISLPTQIFRGDESLMYQVWLNIIGNAIKFSGDDGLIGISLKSDDKSITVIVSDNGCGMSDDVCRHIFEKFYQGDSARKSDGNGLGLALVRRIIDLCGGTVSADSEMGKGTSFTVCLPAETELLKTD